MNRNAVLAVLFALSLAAGLWMFRPSGSPPVATPEPCANDRSCSAGEEEQDPAAQDAPATPAEVVDAVTAEPPSPQPTPPPPAPRPASPPVPAPDGKALREEADRLIAEGRVIEGIETMRRATEADPTAKNHGDLGDILQRLTAVDEALVHLRQAAALDPGNADRWIALANAYYRDTNPGAAWAAEKRAKEAEPGLVLGRDKNGMRVRQGDSAPRKP